MKIEIDNEQLTYACHRLGRLNQELDDLISRLSHELNQQDLWFGKTANIYQQYLKDLILEHQKMIRFYDDLEENLNSMNKDLEEYKINLIDRIKNI